MERFPGTVHASLEKLKKACEAPFVDQSGKQLCRMRMRWQSATKSALLGLAQKRCNLLQLKELWPNVDFGGRFRKCYVAPRPNVESWTMNGSFPPVPTA